MPTSPTYDWVTPALTDPNNVPADLATLAQQIDATVKAQADALDAAAAGFSFGPAWTDVAGFRVGIRRVGRLRIISGLVSLSGSADTTILTIADAADRPPATALLAAAVASGNKAIVQPEVTAAGAVSVPAARRTGTPTGHFALAGVWWV